MPVQTEDGITWCDYSMGGLWWGCARILNDPACGPTKDFPDGAVCYAETLANRFGWNDSQTAKAAGKFPIWGQDAGRRSIKDPIGDLRKFSRAWEKEGSPERNARAFIMSMGDWAENRPGQDVRRRELWNNIPLLHNIDFLMLTKRSHFIADLCPYTFAGYDGSPLEMFRLTRKRVWLGVTAVTQRWFDVRWDHLQSSVALDQIGWVSMEPMAERITLPKSFLDRGKRSWLVLGGQSGPGSVLPFNVEDARYIRDQCREAGVPLHMKQMSGRTKAELTAIPADLMIREYPEAA